MIDIFDEVDEDLRAERFQRAFKRYGGVILAAALLIVVAVGGWQGWRWWQERSDAEAAASFLRAMNTADGLRSGGTEGRADAADAFVRAAAAAPDGYATLGRLRAAALEADAGNLQAALALWDGIARDGSADPLLRDLASLNWAQHQLGSGDPAALEARLQPLTAPGNPWRALATEAQGLLDMRTGQTEKAAAVFHGLAADGAAPDGVRSRANGLLNQLGR